MTNRRIRLIASIVIVITLCTLVFGACSKELDVADSYTVFTEALNNSLQQEIYYYKQTKFNDSGNSTEITVNIHADLDKKYELIVDDNGNYVNKCVRVVHSVDGVETYQQACGSTALQKDAPVKSYLFSKDLTTSGKNNTVYEEMAVDTFIASAEFQAISLQSALDELRYIEYEDMDFSISNGGVSEKGYVTTFTFQLNDSFFSRYYAATGKQSNLVGDYISVQVSYNRIANVLVYNYENMGVEFISYEEEQYKLEISYLGPIISFSSYLPAE